MPETIPTDLVELIVEFNLSVGGIDQEIAEMTIWVAPPAEPDSWDDACLQLAATAWSAWQENLHAGHFTPDVSLVSVTGRHPDAANRTLNKQVYVSGTPWAGSASGASLPWQTSLVCGIYSYTPGTFIQNGRRRRGRVYLPPMAVSVLDGDNSGRVANATAIQVMQEMKAFLIALGAAPLVGQVWGVGVLSRVAGHWYQATDLVVENKLDTQRRRAKNQSGTRNTVGLTP